MKRFLAPDSLCPVKTILALFLAVFGLSAFGQGGNVFITGEKADARRDAFGRLRVSNPVTLLDAAGFMYDQKPTVWQSITNGNATITSNLGEASITLTSGAGGTTNKATRVTYDYFRYSPGKSMLVLMTGVLGNQPAGVRAQLGFGDLANGIFFENWGGTNALVLRSSATGTTNETRILQNEWGGGVSDYDPDLANIYAFDFEWLGVGSIRLYHVRNGEFRQLGAFHNPNTLDKVYMATPHLPLLYRIESTVANAASSTMKQICSTVMVEGGQEEAFGFPRTISTAVAGVACSTNRALIGIRPSLTFNGRTNRSRIKLVDVSASCQSANARLKLVYKPTAVVGSQWTNTVGVVTYDLNGGGVSGGDVLAAWEIVASTGLNRMADRRTVNLRDTPLTLDFNGLKPNELYLVAEPVSGTPVVTADVNIVEEY